MEKVELKDLPDLELAAAIGALHEATVSAAALRLVPEAIGAACRNLIGETIARCRGEPHIERLFAERYRVPVAQLEGFGELILHVSARLQALECLVASRLLVERLRGELPVDPGRHEFGGPEHRTIN